MAFEPSYETINTSFRKTMGTTQQKITCKLLANSGEPIGKILCTKLSVAPQGAEILNAEANCAAKIRCEVVYSSVEGQLNTISDYIDISAQIQNPQLEPSMIALLQVQIIDTLVEDLRQDSVNISGIAEFNLDVIATQPVEFLSQVPSQVVAKTDALNHCIVKANENFNFNISSEYETKENMGRLLFANASICFKDIIPQTGYITLKGSLTINLNYETDQEDKELKSWSKTFDFQEEIDAPNVTGDCIINLVANVEPSEIKIHGSNIDGKTLLRISVGVRGNYVALHKNEVEAISDAFGIGANTNLNLETFTRCKFNLSKVYKERIISTLSLNQDNDYEIDSIQAECGGSAFVANHYTTEGYLMVEGIASANIVYCLQKEENELIYDSTNAQIPFIIEIPFEVATANSSSSVVVKVENLTLRRKRGREIELEVDLCTNSTVWENETEVVIKQIELTPLEEEPVALRMFLARQGSDLWDVAKYIQAHPDIIVEQNPKLTFPLSQDSIVIIYTPLQEDINQVN